MSLYFLDNNAFGEYTSYQSQFCAIPYAFDSYNLNQDAVCMNYDSNLTNNIDASAATLTIGNPLFKHFELNLSKEEINALNQFESAGFKSLNFSDISTSTETSYQGKELREFLHLMSSSEGTDIVADIIINIINSVKMTSIINGNTTYIMVDYGSGGYGWHYDWVEDMNYEDKVIITLIGASTKFYHTDAEFQEIFEKGNSRIKKDEMIDNSKINQAHFGQGSIFKAASALHAHPNYEEQRLVVKIFKEDYPADDVIHK